LLAKKRKQVKGFPKTVPEKAANPQGGERPRLKKSRRKFHVTTLGRHGFVGKARGPCKGSTPHLSSKIHKVWNC